ncbi:hypothetical protein MRB56_14180 [Halomonas cupida]|uniref:hypothetical protein n=1 Tax=Halomonas cupida TaxID=44933 RepID=UPI0039B53D26
MSLPSLLDEILATPTDDASLEAAQQRSLQASMAGRRQAVHSWEIGLPIAEELRATLAGDPDEALSLHVSLNAWERGDVCLALYEARCPAPSFRAFLEETWNHCHGGLMAAVARECAWWPDLLIAALFEYADFPTPDHLPEQFTIWRGTNGIDIDEAVEGYCWTLNRDTAVWFSERFATAERRPLVVAAEVERREVWTYINVNGEEEIVLPGVDVDRAWVDTDAIPKAATA